MKKIFYAMWSASIIALLLYSYTQIDLSLTVSKIEFIHNIQLFFQQIGYFNRPLSTLLFVLLLLLLFSSYAVTLWGVVKKKLARRDIWIAILFSSIVLTLSYNAFSYDLFNYIFDAKIVTEYGQNPYEHKALDYPDDPMLTFMRWTHRTYPYGPTWLFSTVPLSYAGFGYFIPTFFLFKLLASAAFLGTSYCIEQISRLTKKSNALLPLALFALNPLVLIESLVSSHNDIVMMFFAIAALLMYLEKKLVLSSVSILISIGIKFATAVMLPALIVYKLIYKKKENHNVLFATLTIFLFLATCAVTLRTQFQPWYLLYPLTTAVFLGRRLSILIPLIVLSLAALLQYAPYLYLGNWDPPVPLILTLTMTTGIVVSILTIIVFKFLKFPHKI